MKKCLKSGQSHDINSPPSFLKDEMSFFELFLHIHLQQETKLFSKIAWYRAKKTTCFLSHRCESSNNFFWLVCFLHTKPPTKKRTIWTLTQQKTKLVSYVSFVFFFSLQFVGQKNKQTETTKKKEDTSVLRECHLSPMPIFWFLGTTLRPSWQVQVFALHLHLFQLVTATNGGQKKQVELRQTWSNINQIEGSRQKNCSTWRW